MTRSALLVTHTGRRQSTQHARTVARDHQRRGRKSGRCRHGAESGSRRPDAIRLRNRNDVFLLAEVDRGQRPLVQLYIGGPVGG